jgi:hypothetical protein
MTRRMFLALPVDFEDFNNHTGAPYRVLAMVYWHAAAPSIEVFYLLNGSMVTTTTAIAAFEKYVVAILNMRTNGDALGAVYVSNAAVALSEAEMSGVGAWRCLDVMGR